MIKVHPGIKIFDNVFNWEQQRVIYRSCLHAPYNIGWNDTEDKNSESHFYSGIGPDLWDTMDRDPNLFVFLSVLASSEPYQIYKDKTLDKTVINCDTVADSHRQHTHTNQDVILYYANLDWKDSWGGETFFYDENGKEVIFTSPYTPNRMIIFDGNLVHRFNGPSISGPKFRFSISTFFKRNLDKT